MIGFKRSALSALTVALAVTTVLVGCSSSSKGGNGGGGGNGGNGGGGGGTSAAPPPAPVSSGGSAAASGPAALLPADIKKRGYITIAEETDYPPLVSSKPGGGADDLVGADIDLRKALEPILGVQIKQQIMAFDAYIPAMQAHKVDLLGTIIGDLPERRAVADFVDFYGQGNAMLTSSSSKIDFSSLDSLCGRKVGATAGSNTVPLMATQSKACTKAGKPAITQQIFNTQPDGILAAKTGRSDGFFLPTLSGGYIAAQSSGQLKLGPPIGPVTPAGWVVLKGSPLAPALLAAFKELYDNGTLKQIYSKYGIEGGLTPPKLNEAPAS